MILKIVPKITHDMYIQYIYADFSPVLLKVFTRENQPMTETESWTEILMRLSVQVSEFVSVFMEAKCLYLIFSSTRQRTSLKTPIACRESADVIDR